MGRRKPSKSRAPSGTGHKTGGKGIAAAAQAIEPPKVQMPSWFDDVPSYLALAFIALVLATIPYGAPMPSWYMWLMAAVGAALATSLATSPRQRWRQLILWPVPVILGAWACAIAACDFPQEVLARSWGMASYSSIFVAAQVVVWRLNALKGFVLAVLALLLGMAVDLWWSEHFGLSLFREKRAYDKVWYAGDWDGIQGGLWLDERFYGSQNNPNDFAVVSILLPFTACVVPTAWVWGLWSLGAATSIYDVLIVKSRQLMLGLGVGMCAHVGCRYKHKIRWWILGGMIATLIIVVSAHPGTRTRLIKSIDDPLTGRGLVMLYGLDLYKNHPVLGVGPSLFGHYYSQGFRDGWTFNGKRLNRQGMPWVHSLPIEVACELGTLGLISYGIVLWGAFVRVRAALRMPQPARDFAISVCSAALAMGVIATIDLAFIKDWVRICWWLILGMAFSAPTIMHWQPAAKGN